MKNFSFKHDGKEYWYSRSVAAVAYVFGFSKTSSVPHILINKRGSGAPNENDKWNVPCGYLDFDETVAECACRECKEETGVVVDPKTMKLWRINSNPADSASQSVSFSFACCIPTPIEDIKLSDKLSEKNEVAGIKWVPMTEVGNYEFAFGQKEKVGRAWNAINATYPTIEMDIL